ncbi:MAG: A/G-specific adenine glycosylase [Hymenobacteraceae bacterium]|nr:A/G-specific adenine glycosylase [Hymenobacteraceae bacterium]MDX5394705.1 A/G-specific adenine glycosylase [Hymenobacteraceae bacterium]MDX5510738.1 A/G-specific adenine glycosylase [Hymenobacteraceae bacterium]
MPQPSADFFSRALLNWYHQHKRSLPWRDTQDPYAIWLSEIILQQTRVAQGLPYYLRFIEAYPTVKAMAAATEEEVLRLWQGLGYYSRARNMHQTARYIANDLDGNFPDNYQTLLKLKGVGEYTAAAIASFAFKEKVAVVDGNVFRVLARVYGLQDDIATPAGKKVFQKLANELIPEDRPDEFNQAVMEFGAIQCTPALPDCLFCPLQQVCFAFNHGLVQELPVKSKAKKARTRYFHYFVYTLGNKLYLRKRGPNDIWQGLYDFALSSSEQKKLTFSEIVAETQATHEWIEPEQVKPPLKTYKHILSHQRILADFYEIRLKNELPEAFLQETGLQLFAPEQVEQLPKPVLISNYLKDADY